MSKTKSKTVARRTLHFFWQEMKANWRYNLPLLVVVPMAIFLSSFATAWIISATINRLTTAPAVTSDQVLTVFGPYLLLYAGTIIIGEMVCGRLMMWLCWKGEIVADIKLRKRCFDKLAKQSMHFHNEKFGGALVNQLTRFAVSYERMVDMIVWQLLPLATSFLSALLILGFQLPWFALALGLFSLGFMIFAWLSFKGVQSLNQKEAAASSKLTAQLADSITNISAVKSFAGESFEMKLFQNRNLKYANSSRLLMRSIIKRDVGFGAILLALSITTFIFLIGGNAWFAAPIGTLYLAVVYTSNIWEQLWNFNNILRNVNRSFGDAQEMTEILDEPVLVYDVKRAVKLKINRLEGGHVEFRDVTFWHNDANRHDHVFQHFNLDIPAGQRIGLVGHSGSGKTTLTKLILRFADVKSGGIFIDNQDISLLTQHSLRDAIAYVPQDPLLFHRTIRDNIAYARPDASDDDIRQAARQANALDFIEKLPKGFETLTGERGVKLSGGQRQRIAIARAILKDAPILVLDEATSALDTESEKLIQEALKHLMQGRTAIVIAHRLSTVAELDRIVVLSDGQIVEDDKHANLIARGGTYARLWNRQTGLAED